jgi:putative pyruvate formate lyase activating enzyme
MDQPAYFDLFQAGMLRDRAEEIYQKLESCNLCPRNCQVNRIKGEIGSCGVGKLAWVTSYGPHHGEEAPLRGRYGSGTIFFSGCNLGCVYCQNADISQQLSGRPVSPSQLSSYMLELQARGCHNINLVSPTHVVGQIAQAIALAAADGLSLPIVYNTGGYDDLETLRMLDGLIDIYMPDMKYSQGEIGDAYSGVPDYPEVNQQAILEMHRQVGDLVLNPSGIAQRGLLIRHLVLPDGAAGSTETLEFIAEHISKDTYLNIMDQYRPAYQARRYPGLDRSLTRQEFQDVIGEAEELGFSRLDHY